MTFNIYNYIEDPTVSEMIRYQARMYTQLIHGGEMFRPVSRTGKSRFWALGKDGRKFYTDGSYASLEAFRRSYGFEPVDRVVLNFGIAEQAEARAKGYKAELRVLSREEQRAYRAINWARVQDHRRIQKQWWHRNYWGEDADSFKGRRFIGVTEPYPDDSFDELLLHRMTGDNFIETSTMDVSTVGWKPQANLYLSSGKKLQFDNDNEKG